MGCMDFGATVHSCNGLMKDNLPAMHTANKKGNRSKVIRHV